MKKTLAIELEEDLFNTLFQYPSEERDAYIEALIVRDVNEGIEQAFYEKVQVCKQAMISKSEDGETKRAR